jgi:hypothetical protein
MFCFVRTTGRWLASGAVCGGLGFATPASAQTPPSVPESSAPGVVVIDRGVNVGSPGGTPQAAAQPGTPPTPPAGPACDGCEDILKKVPPVRPHPRPGFFSIPPAGPGYYSLADALTGTWREGPPKYPYVRFGLMQPSFFDADFRYLDDPKNTETDFFDPLKRIRLGDDWLFSTGGAAWNRYMNEYNSRLTESNNIYNLTRVRVYGDLWYRDAFRLYGEFLGAYSNWQDLPPQLTDVNRADFLNLFIDVKAAELGGKPVYVRVGRQELLYGSQRLISPPEWLNTRRTFQGVKAFRATEKFDVDLFWVQPVIPNPGELDSVDNNQNFAGVWTTYRPKKGQAIDAYYLMLDNTNNLTQQGIVRAPFTRHTFGGRYSGDQDGKLLWDFEGAMQLGTQAREDVVAGMATAGLGYHWKDAPLTPTAWAYYDYASGDSDPNGGTFHTFNQLFPFGHYYMGWADLVGRQNIHDLNFHLYLYPTKWTTVWLQYHRFWLAAGRDALYGVAGQAYRRDPTGQAGNDVGQELDVILNFHLTKHADLLTGYSHLFGGEFLERTAGPGRGVDSSLYYLQLSYRW